MNMSICICINLAISKAFDSVPHARLIAQLESYGITGKVISWVTGFLNNRKQAVCVNGTVSKWAKVMSGVPQGSVLGPVLFIIYINSLPDSVTNHIKLFADDNKLWAPVKTIEDCDALQNDITASSLTLFIRILTFVFSQIRFEIILFVLQF